MAEGFSLLETMRLDEGHIPRLERHLARMASSARHFDYVWNEPAVRAAIVAAQRDHPSGCWRLRLLVTRDGTPTVECTLHVPPHSLPPSSPQHGTSFPWPVWRVAFARNPVDERDPFLFHKTTQRSVYETAYRERDADVKDVILWNRRGEVTESTIANVVVLIGGTMYTPPIECGLLGGTFRAELLESGAIRERVLTREDVVAARDVLLINSLRERVIGLLVK